MVSLNRFLVCLNYFVLLFLVISWLIMAVQPSIDCIPIKENTCTLYFNNLLTTSYYIPIVNIIKYSKKDFSVLIIYYGSRFCLLYMVQ